MIRHSRFIQEGQISKRIVLAGIDAEQSELLVRQILEPLGYVVELAESIEHALTLLGRGDVVLLIYEGPLQDGSSTFSHLRNAAQNDSQVLRVRILLLNDPRYTGMDFSLDPRSSPDLLLTKPFHPAELRAHVKRLLS